MNVGSKPASSKKNWTSNLRIPVPPCHLELNNPETIRWGLLSLQFTALLHHFSSLIMIFHYPIVLKIAILFWHSTTICDFQSTKLRNDPNIEPNDWVRVPGRGFCFLHFQLVRCPIWGHRPRGKPSAIGIRWHRVASSRKESSNKHHVGIWMIYPRCICIHYHGWWLIPQ